MSTSSNLQCSDCLQLLSDCQCGPEPFRAMRTALFSGTQAHAETAPEALAKARARVAEATAKHGRVFVQEAWRRVVDGLPEGYKPIPYPKWQFHPTHLDRIVETLEEHRALYAEDARWTEPPVDDLLALFMKELQ